MFTSSIYSKNTHKKVNFTVTFEANNKSHGTREIRADYTDG